MVRDSICPEELPQCLAVRITSSSCKPARALSASSGTPTENVPPTNEQPANAEQSKPPEALLALHSDGPPQTLERSFTGATYVVGAWEADALVGVCRVLSDDASILYVQDILVDPDHQRRGIGRALWRTS